MERVKYSIDVSKETAHKLQQLAEFQNMKIKLGTAKGPAVYPSDIIKAALADYLDLFYSSNDVSSLSGINMKDSHIVINRFKDIMESKNMKQVDLCKITGISKTNLSQILHNKYQPRLELFLKIWVALDCPPINEVLYLKEIR